MKREYHPLTPIPNPNDGDDEVFKSLILVDVNNTRALLAHEIKIAT